MVIIPKILVLLFIDASHVKKSGHRQTLKNGTCGDRTHDLEGGTPSLSPIVPWKRKSWTFPYINYRSYLLWPYIPKVVRPIPIGIEWVPWWKKWKFFHFGKKFSTSKKFSRKKNFYSKITWIGTFCRGGNFSTFGGKISTLAKFCFRVLDLSVCHFWAQICKVEIFPLWWKIFHFQKVAKKKNFFAELHELEHSAEVENFPLLVENFPLWWNFIFGI